MKRKVLSRRGFVAASAAASATLIAAPFVRTAHAAGKLSIGLWDHWVPGANDTSQGASSRSGRDKEKVDVQIDYITSQGEKQLLTIAAEAQADRATTSCRCRAGGRTTTPRASSRSTTSWSRADQAERRRERDGRVSRPSGRAMARGAGDARQQDQGTLLAHRPDEAARRHRRAGDVSGRRPAQGRELDARHIPQGRGGVPQGRVPVRHRARHDRGLGRHRRRDLPARSARHSSTPTGRSPSRPTRCARRSTTTRGLPSSSRPMRRPGTMPPTTSGWCPARAR